MRPTPQAIQNTRAQLAEVEGERRPLQPLQHRRRPLGQAQSAPALDRPLRQPDLSGGSHELPYTGAFPAGQAANWDFAQEQIANAGREINVLNLFAYTGGATVACAAAGAKVCHVDAAKGMVAWAKENARLSHLSDAPVRWIVDDCAKFVEREIRRGRRYDALIMDPPSYGRGPSGEVWKLEENLYPFLELVVKVLSDQPLFVIINSYTTGLAPSVLGYLLDTLVTKKYGGHTECQELGLPVTASGLALPCGATGRWMAGQGGRGRR